jgi:hypothetical protein
VVKLTILTIRIFIAGRFGIKLIKQHQATTSTQRCRYSACESYSECGIETARRTARHVPLGALSSFRIALPAQVALSRFKVIEYRRSSFRSGESTDLSENPWVNRFAGAKMDRQCSFVESRMESLFFPGGSSSSSQKRARACPVSRSRKGRWSEPERHRCLAWHDAAGRCRFRSR